MTDAHTARSEKFWRKYAVLDVLTPSSIQPKESQTANASFHSLFTRRHDDPRDEGRNDGERHLRGLGMTVPH